jgi:sugar/nucleoside kinase (ribokinase family)
VVDTVFVVIGDVMVDDIAPLHTPLVLDHDNPVRFHRIFGGQGANTAAWCATQTRGSDHGAVHLIGSVGSDSEAAWVTEQLVDRDITPRLETTSSPTGRCVIVVAPDGGRTMYPDAGANASMSLAHVREQFQQVFAQVHPSSHCHVHMSGYFVARLPDVAKAFLHDIPHDVTVSIDASALVLDAQQRLDLLQVAASSHVFLANRAELAAVTAPHDPDPALLARHEDRADGTMNLEASMEAMRDQTGFDGVMVAKDGSNGAYAEQQGAWLHVPARDVVAVDTTGAGDAFTAGFLAAWTSWEAPAASGATEERLRRALEAGTDLAAQSVTRTGGNPG